MFLSLFHYSQAHTEKISCSVPLVSDLTETTQLFLCLPKAQGKVDWTLWCIPLFFSFYFSSLSTFFMDGDKFLRKAVPTPRLSSAVIRRLPHVPQWASSTLQVQLFLPSTYWEWQRIASFNLASYRCYQAGTLTVFKPVSARVTEHVSILSAHYGFFFF